MYAFDRDTAIEPVLPGRWTAHFHERWNVAGVPNGGYVMAVAARALAGTLPHPHPLSVTARFLRRPAPGRVGIVTDALHVGRRHSTGQARILQDGEERARVVATFADQVAAEGPSLVVATPPDLPDPDELISSVGQPGLPPVVRHFDHRFTPASMAFALGERHGDPVAEGWTRFVDGREPDPISLLMFADALPPPVLNVIEAPWVPTIEMTVHVRAIPAPGWLAYRFSTRALVDGYLDEDGELWDSQGRLVAMSRQIALALPADA